MDSDIMHLVTVYNKEGRRVELRIAHSLEEAEATGLANVAYWGEGASHKVWEAHEVKNVKETAKQ